MREVTEENLEDTFRVCSRNKLDDPRQRKGIAIKRQWVKTMLRDHGPVSMIAYLEGEPAAYVMYYPEEALPYEPHPRKGVLRVECIYNSSPEARGKGVGKALLSHLIAEATKGLACMEGECRFLAAEAFNTGEGVGMEDFYLSGGFTRGEGELYYLIHGEYEPKTRVSYEPTEEDRGKGIVFYNRNCEYSYLFALRIEEALGEAAPDLPMTFVDMWERPMDAARRGVSYLLVNAKPIKSFIGDKEAFRAEVQEALKPQRA
ncbi:MAG: GNAT family N-acetyltransferase [Candidatus Bathyarchaeota archaeon]